MEEARKFLDLDMVAEQIRDAGDQAMFREAVQCYHIGSYRAAVILVWIATTNCLYRFLEKLHDDRDGDVSKSFDVVKDARDKEKGGYESTLLDHCKKSELLSEYEWRALSFIRDTRNKCAHTSEVRLSAEAVRYVLVTCAEYVLCRREYRGTAFIKDLVTTQFHDQYFLPNEQRAREDCRNNILRVRKHLWHLFVRIAAEQNPTATPEIWQQNARFFFKVLLEECDDDTVLAQIVSACQRFEAGAREFAALLVGLEKRALPHWDKQKRDQARVILTKQPVVRVEQIESWAIICEHDGIAEQDRTFLRSRIAQVAQHLPASFVQTHSDTLLELLADIAEDDINTEQAAAALRKPFVTSLGKEPNRYSERLVRQIIERFALSERYREVLESVKTWSDGLLVQFMLLTETFLLQCSEDRPEDVIILFEAATELAERIHLDAPPAFGSAVKALLQGDLQPDWSSPDSDAGANVKRYLQLLIEKHAAVYSQLREECSDHIARYQAEIGIPADEEVAE